MTDQIKVHVTPVNLKDAPVSLIPLTHDQVLTIKIALLEEMARCMRQLSAVDALALRVKPDGTPAYPDLSESATHWRERHADLQDALEALRPAGPERSAT